MERGGRLIVHIALRAASILGRAGGYRGSSGRFRGRVPLPLEPGAIETRSKFEGQRPASIPAWGNAPYAYTEETVTWTTKRLRPSFPNSVWERAFGRNSVSHGGCVRGPRAAPACGPPRLGNRVPLPSAFPNGVWERGPCKGVVQVTVSLVPRYMPMGRCPRLGWMRAFGPQIWTSFQSHPLEPERHIRHESPATRGIVDRGWPAAKKEHSYNFHNFPLARKSLPPYHARHRNLQP